MVDDFAARQGVEHFVECQTGIELAAKMRMLRAITKITGKTPESLKAQDIMLSTEGAGFEKAELEVLKKSTHNIHLAKSGYDAEKSAKGWALLLTCPVIDIFFEEMARQENRTNSLAVEKFIGVITSYASLNKPDDKTLPMALTKESGVKLVEAFVNKQKSPTPRNLNAYETEKLKLAYLVGGTLNKQSKAIFQQCLLRAFRYFAGFELAELPAKKQGEGVVSYGFTVKEFVDSVEKGFRSMLGKKSMETYVARSRDAFYGASDEMGIPRSYWQAAAAAK